VPSSNLWVAGHLVEMVARTGAKRVLDVGPGHGKFGVLLREYSAVKVIDAVEAWEPYVAAFRLNGIYDGVMTGDALGLSDGVLASYDLIFMSEVIEHLGKADGMALLERIPGWVVLSTPLEWFQEEHEVPTERHRSLWAADDFSAPGLVDRVFECKETDGGLFITLKPKAATRG
jgi:2-polyprenyl-3-methyl-5-hydroxy-6-metoxy-1,4-benzoquinol methylase